MSEPENRIDSVQAAQEHSFMTKAGLVSHVSGDVGPERDQIRLRIEADELSQTVDLRFPVVDVQALVILLLVLSGKAATGSSSASPLQSRPTLPLPVDAVSIGEDQSGEIVLQMDIGQTTLAFLVPATLSQQLGQTLLTMSASASTGSS